MTELDIEKIVNANSSNKYFFEHLDINTQNLVKDILIKLDAEDFVEINEDAQFDITCIPIPYDKLNCDKFNFNKKPLLSKVLQDKTDKLLTDINTKGKNYEYPYILCGLSEEDEKYTDRLKMNSELKQTSCSYDWKTINSFLNQDLQDVNFALFHTHPNLFNEKYNTIAEKYKEELKEFDIKPNGLNLSLSDIFVNLYLEMLVEKRNNNISVQSVVLMHDGTLLSFSTKDKVSLDSLEKLEIKEFNNTTNNEEIFNF
ncbi:MAG: hypothetical protein E7359_02840 [Clostridiales bacterium]|nr:hypothetical protein [Clostridiales bacterium]